MGTTANIKKHTLHCYLHRIQPPIVIPLVKSLLTLSLLLQLLREPLLKYLHISVALLSVVSLDYNQSGVPALISSKTLEFLQFDFNLLVSRALSGYGSRARLKNILKMVEDIHEQHNYT